MTVDVWKQNARSKKFELDSKRAVLVFELLKFPVLSFFIFTASSEVSDPATPKPLGRARTKKTPLEL